MWKHSHPKHDVFVKTVVTAGTIFVTVLSILHPEYTCHATVLNASVSCFWLWG